MLPFEIGKTYRRQSDIHDVYGGSRQSGISPSANHPFIFIFSGSTGEAYGYEDGWQDAEQTFLYSGQGQLGDMNFTLGNRAIRDHVVDGRQLLLFEALGKGLVRFSGEFVCAGYDFGTGPDRDGTVRRTIRFILAPIERGEVPDEPLQEERADLTTLRDRAITASLPAPTANWREARTILRARSQVVKAYVLQRAEGICELTGEPAPFLTKGRQPYLEVHHIKRLSDGGLDHPVNCAAISPTAHREIHHGAEGAKLDEKLAELIAQKEALLDRQG
jgi:5-methylcytosine-specific restriction protein A